MAPLRLVCVAAAPWRFAAYSSGRHSRSSTTLGVQAVVVPATTGTLGRRYPKTCEEYRIPAGTSTPLVELRRQSYQSEERELPESE